MLYIRDFLQIIQTSQTLQRHDSWTLWNFLEIMETNEFPDGTDVPPQLQLQIKTSAANAMRVFASETSIDLQLFFIDYYLAAMNQQAFQQAAPPAAAPAPASFIQEELSEEAQPSKPFLPMMMMSNPGYMMYYTWMLKFYSKYMVSNAAQTLSTAAHIDLQKASGVAHDAQQGYYPQSHASSSQLKRAGLSALTQWVQIRYFLVYLDFMTMYMGSFPQTTPQGHAAAASNLVQTDVPESVPAQQEEPVHSAPVIENQAQAIPAPVAEQVRDIVEGRQSVVG
jgi:hypothetical protein